MWSLSAFHTRPASDPFGPFWIVCDDNPGSPADLLDGIEAVNYFLMHGEYDGEQDMNIRLRFPNLYGLCGCYFHQDWDMDDPTPEAVIRRYCLDADPQEVQRVASEINEFLRIEMTEEERRTVLGRFGCEYLPSADDVSYSEWLRQVHDLLTGKR